MDDSDTRSVRSSATKSMMGSGYGSEANWDTRSVASDAKSLRPRSQASTIRPESVASMSWDDTRSVKSGVSGYSQSHASIRDDDTRSIRSASTARQSVASSMKDDDTRSIRSASTARQSMASSMKDDDAMSVRSGSTARHSTASRRSKAPAHLDLATLPEMGDEESVSPRTAMAIAKNRSSMGKYLMMLRST